MLEDITKTWINQLRQCQYAGEVVVEETSLPGLAKEVRRGLFSDRPSDATATGLFVLAVNCMYYHHDEDGFWAHFCELMTVENTPETQARLGGILEKQLLAFRFLPKPGHGPFRYVSPVRKQCGITRREIPKFATLLTDITGVYGWDGIRVMSQTEFINIVAIRPPRSQLAEFLYTSDGYAFVRDVARNISQYQRKILTENDLDTLTGYRTGFFGELFRALKEIEPPSDSVTRPPLPHLMFFAEYQIIGLSFDPDTIIAGGYRVDGTVMRQNPLLWRSVDDFQKPVTIERRDSNGTWSTCDISVWDPAEQKVALFHTQKGYTDHKAGIRPGEYFMLGPYTEPPPQEVVSVECGMVDLPFPDMEYEAWRISINEDTDLKFLGIERVQLLPSTDLIAWSDTNTRLQGTLESEAAFTGALPLLEVKNPGLFRTGAVAIFADTSKGIHPLTVDVDNSRIRLDIAPPSQGRIWVEPISRLREFSGIDVLCELRFRLLPECRIEWPCDLYAFDEEPEVLFSPETDTVSLELKNATALDDTRRQWRIAPGETVVHGHISTRQFTVSIAHQVYRASLRHGDGRVMESLQPGLTEPDETWILTGLPKSDAVLAITDGNEFLALASLGIFNEAGECRFAVSAIRDTISNWMYPAGIFAIKHDNRIVPTTTHYIDCQKLIAWICANNDNIPPFWAETLHSPVRQIFDITRSIRATAPIELPPQEDTAVVPGDLCTFSQTVRACAIVFDKAVLPDNPDMTPETIESFQPALPSEISEALQWYVKASAVAHAVGIDTVITPEDLLDEHHRLNWSPPFPRWKAAITEVLSHIEANIDALPLVEEFSREVKAGFQNTYRSQISKQQGGHELTTAWIHYFRFANYQSVINSMTPFIRHARSPVSDLAGILLRLCYIRQALFESQPTIPINSTSEKVRSVFEDMNTLVELGKSGGGKARPHLETLYRFMPSLPLRLEDTALIEAVHAGRLPDDCENEWVICYYVRHLYNLGLWEWEPPSITNLPHILGQIPASPERTRIINTLEGN